MTSSYLNSNTYIESVDSVVYIEFAQDEANGPVVIEVISPGAFVSSGVSIGLAAGLSIALS